MEWWQAFRSQFPISEEFIYLNHAAVSPLPRRCREEMESYLDELTRYGAARYPDVVWNSLTETRVISARLLGARPDQIFFVRSTSQGLGIAATGIPFSAGDNLVLVEHEFPANLRPWLPLRKRGVDVRLVPQKQGRVLIDDLAAAVDGKTRAVSVSFVQFLSGFRIELGAVAELCHRVDALCVVDAIQGLGAFPVDAQACGIDFLSADSHKWMLGPEGAGVGFISDRALERIEPALEGWLAVERPFDFFDLDQPLKSWAARFEEGAYNNAGLRGMKGSLQVIEEAGPERISRRIIDLTDYLADGLVAREWRVISPRKTDGEKSGILLVERDGIDADAMERKLKEEKIVLSVRDGRLRIAPHGYNTVEELDRLLGVLKKI
ncbi:MAG TPA: aminotransferase class V-fold PLP-dependent enzyme [Myxococcota bacterium]|nr:aminotransferase class V-fold PLP-dependent enzyme [Myxococcota bacterium]